jgi:hypothetical protein
VQISGQAAHARRGAADRGEHRQAAGATQVVYRAERCRAGPWGSRASS